MWLHKVLYLVKGRCYRSAGTGKSLLYLFWWCQKTIPYYLMFYKKCTKGTKRRIQVGTAIKCKYVFKLYAYDKYNLAKTYKSCTIICNILRVENQVFLRYIRDNESRGFVRKSGGMKKKVKETSAKYEGIVRWIREQIEAEELQPGERIESEYQLCDRFGVSRQTVRHAIAVLEKEGMIEKRRGSGTYIKESGIIGVRRKKTMQIAVMTTFVQEYIFSGIIQEIENKMSSAGYGIQISITNNSVEKERFILKSILDKKRVDGIIAEPTKSGLPNPNLDLYRHIMEQGIPVIFINSYYPELKAPHVSLDDKMAGKMATEYLIQCGHREIAAIFKADDGQGHRRYAGYIEALMEADIRIKDERVVWIDTEDVRNRNMREESSWILRRIQGCTACVCYNDEVASSLAATCLEQKIKVPDKMSIIGIDDSDLANYCEVPLASVKNPIRELAKKAAEEILDLMQEKEVPDSVELKPEIINRSSVKIIK